MKYENLNEHSRRVLFLVAAYMANVDGEEHGTEVDALCQLRTALGLDPATARELLQEARGAMI